MKVDLYDKVAIITGAAGSIGSSTAKELALNGAKVVINDLNEQSGRQLAEQIINEGNDALYQKGDITNEKDIIDLVNLAVQKFGTVDILVNNVGVNVGKDKRKIMYDYDTKAWNMVVNICLDSIYYCCKHVIDIMVKQNHGKIINIGSVAGWNVPLKQQSPYCAAKAEIINITKSMAIQYAKNNINVNAVVPGSIINEQVKAAVYGDEGHAKSMLAHIPAGHIGSPIDIANAVLYLASNESNYVNGAVLNVDGGWTAGYAFDIEKMEKEQ